MEGSRSRLKWQPPNSPWPPTHSSGSRPNGQGWSRMVKDGQELSRIVKNGQGWRATGQV